MTDPVKELLPCPFCGETRISFNPPNGKFKGSINCPGCLASMPREVNDDQELIDCWNTRHRPACDVGTLKRECSDMFCAHSGRGAAEGVIDYLASRHLLPGDGWKTIDSAPRDGTIILAFWNPKGEGYGTIDIAHYEDGLWFDPDKGGNYAYGASPTHWMPLPAAPKEGE